MVPTTRGRNRSKPPTRLRKRSLWYVVAVGVLVFVGAVWWTAAGRLQSQQIGERVANEGFEHVPFGTTAMYQAHPPASGTHYPGPAAAGVYPGRLAPGYWIHNLEHGYIVLLYRPPVSEDLLGEFDKMVRDFPKSKFKNVKLVIAPYPDMLHPFAVLGWDWRLEMDSFDRAKILTFYRAHVDHGREDLP